MIKVDKDFDRCPEALTPREIGHRIENLLTEKNRHAFSTAIYRHKSVRKALGEIYHQKCAYCESGGEASAALQVEHYRPKNGLAGDPNHSGYYWLAYEWSNLLLACSKCNRAKSNRFPIAGTRIREPPDRTEWRCGGEKARAEQPLLLNPEQDEPEQHLSFTAQGLVVAEEGDPRGEATISVCRLNRDPLVLARLTKVNGFRRLFLNISLSLLQYWKEMEDKKPDNLSRLIEAMYFPVFEYLLEETRFDKEHSAFGQHVLDNFGTWILDYLPPGDAQGLVRYAFARFSEAPHSE